jgi:hypothetical protein
MEQSITGLIELLLNTRPELLFFVAGTCAGAIFIILGISDYIMPSLVKDIKDIASKQPLKEQWRLCLPYFKRFKKN